MLNSLSWPPLHIKPLKLSPQRLLHNGIHRFFAFIIAIDAYFILTNGSTTLTCVMSSVRMIV